MNFNIKVILYLQETIMLFYFLKLNIFTNPIHFLIHIFSYLQTKKTQTIEI